MLGEHTEAAEKKVEYLELIYDLIFVYLVGRNNALLHVSEGFFTASAFVTYLASSLVILQIWYFSTVFISRYGSNGVSDHSGLFVNMFLLYFLADGVRLDWGGHYTGYNLAWGLILVNLAAQYFIQLRKSHGMTPCPGRTGTCAIICFCCSSRRRWSSSLSLSTGCCGCPSPGWRCRRASSPPPSRCGSTP